MTSGAYAQLLERYLGGQISPLQLRERFNRAFQTEPVDMDQGLFFILNPVWASLEAYSPRVSVGEENPVLISETTLRRDIEAGLSRLRQYARSVA